MIVNVWHFQLTTVHARFQKPPMGHGNTLIVKFWLPGAKSVLDSLLKIMGGPDCLLLVTVTPTHGSL